MERLLLDEAKGQFSVGKGYGRQPSCIVMLPTRELAKQVSRAGDVYTPIFDVHCIFRLHVQVQEVLSDIGKAANLTLLTVYGGTPYEGQEKALRSVRVVATPPLNLSPTQF